MTSLNSISPVPSIGGPRTQLDLSALPALVADPAIAVRSCVAHLLAACLRHANDVDDDVRAKAAEAAGALRSERLRPFKTVLAGLIDSLPFLALRPNS